MLLPGLGASLGMMGSKKPITGGYTSEGNSNTSGSTTYNFTHTEPSYGQDVYLIVGCNINSANQTNVVSSLTWNGITFSPLVHSNYNGAGTNNIHSYIFGALCPIASQGATATAAFTMNNANTFRMGVWFGWIKDWTSTTPVVTCQDTNSSDTYIQLDYGTRTVGQVLFSNACAYVSGTTTWTHASPLAVDFSDGVATTTLHYTGGHGTVVSTGATALNITASRSQTYLCGCGVAFS